MSDQDIQAEDRGETGGRDHSRARFLAIAAGTGAALIAAETLPAVTKASSPLAACADDRTLIVNTLLVVEQVAAGFYYTGLTTRAVVGHPYLAGASADPNNVSSNGVRVNVASLQAALDQERQHAALWVAQGAHSAHTHCYFPATTFHSLGYTSQRYTFLGVLDHLETLLIGAYLSAVSTFANQRHTALVLLCARIFGPECQHRAIGRGIAGDTPANNMALQVNSFNCMHDVSGALHPYLTGHGFAGGATSAVAFPGAAAMSRVIGGNRSK